MSKISIFAATIFSLSIQIHAANAGFVGMPLNLRAAVGDAGMVLRSHQPDADGVRPTPIVIISC